MKILRVRSPWLLATLFLLSSCAKSNPNIDPPLTSLPQSIPLWPNTAPGSEGQTAPEIITWRTDPATPFSPARTVPIITHINNPSITPFFPDPKLATGVALIIAPGGGHTHLAVQHEGYDVAQLFASKGITCFVLKYRLAKEPGSPYKIEIHSLMDAQRAIRYVRFHAADWHLNPLRIGIMGFSAGGQIALLATTQFNSPIPGSNDSIDQINPRPDFTALLYPSGLTLPIQIPLNKNTPPMFLVDVQSDPRSLGVAALFTKLQTLSIPAELHIYTQGKEGFAIRPSPLPVTTWPDRFQDWLQEEDLQPK
jgi:hypothetical protein